jgi:hypothetical protein
MKSLFGILFIALFSLSAFASPQLVLHYSSAINKTDIKVFNDGTVTAALEVIDPTNPMRTPPQFKTLQLGTLNMDIVKVLSSNAGKFPTTIPLFDENPSAPSCGIVDKTDYSVATGNTEVVFEQIQGCHTWRPANDGSVPAIYFRFVSILDGLADEANMLNTTP